MRKTILLVLIVLLGLIGCEGGGSLSGNEPEIALANLYIELLGVHTEYEELRDTFNFHLNSPEYHPEDVNKEPYLVESVEKSFYHLMFPTNQTPGERLDKYYEEAEELQNSLNELEKKYEMHCRDFHADSTRFSLEYPTASPRTKLAYMEAYVDFLRTYVRELEEHYYDHLEKYH